jgi:hypothetical protein
MAAAVLFCSCGGSLRNKIAVTGPINWNAESLTKAVVSCTVENSSCHKIRILDGRFRLHTAMGDVATVLLQQEVTIPRRAVTELEIPVRVRFNDPLALLALPKGLLVSGEAAVRMGPAKKKFRVADEPVSEFIDTFAR